MKIRDFKPGDAAHLARIFHESIRTVGREDYTQAQVEVWSPEPVSSDRFLARVSDGRSVFVATSENDNPVGFIELEENGHIDCFYCHPDAVGNGVGTMLFQTLEQAARVAGLPRLFVEASEAARRFFLGRGFDIVERRDFERGNVRIHNYLMEKTLQ